MTFVNLKWTRESKEYSIQPEWIEISTMGRNPNYPNSQAVINLLHGRRVI